MNRILGVGSDSGGFRGEFPGLLIHGGIPLVGVLVSPYLFEHVRRVSPDDVGIVVAMMAFSILASLTRVFLLLFRNHGPGMRGCLPGIAFNVYFICVYLLLLSLSLVEVYLLVPGGAPREHWIWFAALAAWFGDYIFVRKELADREREWRHVARG